MPTKSIRKAWTVRAGTASRVRAKTGSPGRLLRKATAEASQELGLRERKKARLRQQIIDTSIRLFRKRGYENTRVEDIVQILEISQPTFFRYFPSKDAVLREVGRRGFNCIKEHLESELSSDATTAGDKVKVIPLPASAQATAIYPIGIVKGSKNAKAAQQWIDLVMSPQGQQVLVRDGFGPAPSS